MLTKLIRFLKWLFVPEELPPPAEEPARKAGFFAWLIAQDSLDGARFRAVGPVKKQSFFGRLFGRERLEFDEPVRSSRPGLLRTIFAPDRLDAAPAGGRKSRSLLAWLFSTEKL